MSDVKASSVRFLTVLVFLTIVCNVLVSCLAVNKVRTGRQEFVITEAIFRNAVGLSVSNYLSTVVSNLQYATEDRKAAISVKVVLLNDLVIFYRPFKKSWVVRYFGSDFVEGDYFEDGVIKKIADGRCYVQTNDEIIIYRPRVHADAPSGAPRVPRAEEDARL